MGISELYQWADYLSKEPANSVEIQMALNTQQYNNSMGGKATLEDMLVTAYRSDKVTTEDEALATRPSSLAVDFAFSAFKK